MIKDVIRQTNKYTNKHSPIIMTGLGIIGVATTSFLSARAGWKAKASLESAPADLSIQEKAKLTWTFYIPPVTTGLVTVGAITYANRLGAKRTAAAISAYTIVEGAFSEYRNKVVEEVGSHREQMFRDDIARKEVGAKSSELIIMSGSGDVMCCELFTRRYFMSDMETLRRAQNDINARIMSDMYVALDEWYDLIGLQPTTASGRLGWDSDKLMELEFSSVLSEDNKPCIAFNYNYVKPI